MYAALEAAPFEQGALVVNHDGGVAEYAHGFGDWSAYGPAEVLGENFAEGINPVDDPIIVYSLSKTFAAVAVIAAIEDSAISGLDYDTLAGSLINDVSPPVRAEMRLHHLLSMTNGQDSPIPYPTNVLTCINNPLFTFETCGKNVSNKAQACNTHTLNLFDQYAPGDAFSYGALPWQYLGLAALRAVNASLSSNLTFTELFRRYFVPAAQDEDCDFDDTTITPVGNEWIAGGFYTTPKDGAALAEILRTGMCGDHQVLSASALEMMRSNVGLAAIFSQSNPDNSDPRLDYGMGLWISDSRNAASEIVLPDVTEDDLYLGIGADGAVVFFLPGAQWSAYLHLSKSLSYQDAVNLAITLAPLITDALQNPD